VCENRSNQDWDLVDLTYFKINDSHQKTTPQSAPNSAKEATSSTTTPPLSSSGLRRSWDGLPVGAIVFGVFYIEEAFVFKSTFELYIPAHICVGCVHFE
jgi:hypothetical protein